MPDVLAGDLEDFTDDQRRLCEVGSKEIMVFRHRDDFYAYENKCPHNGGPVGEGILIGKVEAAMAPDGCSVKEWFSEKDIHIVCPWHGWEFNVETGRAAGEPRARMRRYPTDVRDGKVYVSVQ